MAAATFHKLACIMDQSAGTNKTNTLAAPQLRELGVRADPKWQSLVRQLTRWNRRLPRAATVIPEVQFAIRARTGRTGPRDALWRLQGKRLQDFLNRNIF
ncbi:hypothetical protein FKM82_031155 [Ascaphus truei]